MIVNKLQFGRTLIFMELTLIIKKMLLVLIMVVLDSSAFGGLTRTITSPIILRAKSRSIYLSLRPKNVYAEEMKTVTLASLIDEALENNPAIQVAYNKWKAAARK